MPIYEYRCSGCAHVFEEWAQHFDSPEAEKCPRCGADAHRIVSNTSFMLKGGGWYVTEYGTHKGKTEGGPAAETHEAAPDTAKAKADAPQAAGNAGAEPSAKPEPKTAPAAKPAPKAAPAAQPASA